MVIDNFDLFSNSKYYTYLNEINTKLENGLISFERYDKLTTKLFEWFNMEKNI